MSIGWSWRTPSERPASAKQVANDNLTILEGLFDVWFEPSEIDEVVAFRRDNDGPTLSRLLGLRR